MVSFKIPNELLEQFKTADVPYMSFDQFNNLVKIYRDEHYAAKHIENFVADIGRQYNLWTVDTYNRYSRNLFFDQITKPLYISLLIPHCDKAKYFPLLISIYDEDDEYFSQEQNVAVQRIIGSKVRPTSWRKIEALSDFVLAEVEDSKVIK